MSQLPTTEARIANLEVQSVSLGARLEDLKRHMDQGFEQAHAYIREHIEERMATKDDIRALQVETTSIRAEISAMEDRLKTEMLAMENRLLDVLKQILDRGN